MKSKKPQRTSELNCVYCGKEFKYESERKRHEQSHSPQFECKVCAKKFSFISAVRRHEKQHERTGSVVCTECNRKFRDESLLKRHMKYAHKGSFTCNKCDTTFSSELALRAHTKTHQPESERKFHCNFTGCTKTFNFSHHLKHHELTHTNTKQHYCNICGKGFIQSHHLKSHKKKHEPADRLTCDISGCKKTFSTEYAMKRHLSTHKEIKPEDMGDTASERKSSCDITELIESDSIICVTCDQVFLRNHYTEHMKECDFKKEALNIESIPKETQETLIEKLDTVRIELDDDISTCKLYVGGCIMGVDANGNDKCLCAQISRRRTDFYELTPNENKIPPLKIEDQKTSERDEKDDNVCEGCECASNKTWCNTVPKNESFEKTDVKNDIPNIEYRNDGTIKIKDTFDIEMSTSRRDKVKYNFDIPYNSCKAVLGKCIVSGNGTIDEGCLCARMAMDDQQMIAQEIDELTPCPK